MAHGHVTACQVVPWTGREVEGRPAWDSGAAACGPPACPPRGTTGAATRWGQPHLARVLAVQDFELKQAQRAVRGGQVEPLLCCCCWRRLATGAGWRLAAWALGGPGSPFLGPRAGGLGWRAGVSALALAGPPAGGRPGRCCHRMQAHARLRPKPPDGAARAGQRSNPTALMVQCYQAGGTGACGPPRDHFVAATTSRSAGVRLCNTTNAPPACLCDCNGVWVLISSAAWVPAGEFRLGVHRGTARSILR